MVKNLAPHPFLGGFASPAATLGFAAKAKALARNLTSYPGYLVL